MGNPVYRKLGILEDSQLCVINAPYDYNELTQVPFDVRIDSSNKLREYFFMHLFAKDLEQLVTFFPEMKSALSKSGMLWVAWPKKSGKLKSDLDGNKVRDYGLSQGLVDVKIASLDKDWSALKFVYRLRDRG